MMFAIGVGLLVLALVSLVGALFGILLGTYDDYPEKLMCVFFVSCILGLVFIFPAMAEHDEEIMQECLKDHKRYECEAMLYRRTNDTIVTPVIIQGR